MADRQWYSSQRRQDQPYHNFPPPLPNCHEYQSLQRSSLDSHPDRHASMRHQQQWTTQYLPGPTVDTLGVAGQPWNASYENGFPRVVVRHPVGHTSNELDVPENRFNNLTFHNSAQHLHFQTTGIFDTGENSLYGAPDNVTVTMDSGYGNVFVQVRGPV
jgi:hypothetical protein